MIRILVASLGTLLGVAPIAAQAPAMWNQLEPGEHEVGFTRLWELDHSRIHPRLEDPDSVPEGFARPIRIDVWYPTICGDAERMRLRDYIFMDAPESAFADLVLLTRRWDEYSFRGLAARDSSQFDRLVDFETAACRDGPPADGRFPLVVYSAGWFNRTPDNLVLHEFLASHGFVVVSVPQLNPGLWTYSFASDPRSVEHQIRDLEVALGRVVREPMVDPHRVAAMGYSTGGDVALLLQGRNPLVDLVVGLDASWSVGSEHDVTSPLFDAAGQARPVIAVRRPPEDRAAAHEILRMLTAAHRLVVDVCDADHGSFSDDPAQRLLLEVGPSEAAAMHGKIAEIVLRALQVGLADRSEPRDWRGLASGLGAAGINALYAPAGESWPDGGEACPG